MFSVCSFIDVSGSGGVVVVVVWCGLWWWTCGGGPVVVDLCRWTCGGGPVVVDLWWWTCGLTKPCDHYSRHRMALIVSIDVWMTTGVNYCLLDEMMYELIIE